VPPPHSTATLVRLTITLISCLFGVSCSVPLPGCPRQVSSQPVRRLSTYPFTASAERAATIREGYKRATVGMSAAEITAVLGEADEIYPVYNDELHIWCSKVPHHLVGYAKFFIIQRLAADASAGGREETLVRVTFTLDDRVKKVGAWSWDASARSYVDGLGGSPSTMPPSNNRWRGP